MLSLSILEQTSCRRRKYLITITTMALLNLKSWLSLLSWISKNTVNSHIISLSRTYQISLNYSRKIKRNKNYCSSNSKLPAKYSRLLKQEEHRNSLGHCLLDNKRETQQNWHPTTIELQLWWIIPYS